MRNTFRVFTGSLLLTALLVGGFLTGAVSAAENTPAPTSAGAPSTERRVEETPSDGPRSASINRSLRRQESVTSLRRPALPPVPPVVIPDERVFAVDSAGQKFIGADPELVRDGDVWRVFTTETFWSNVPSWESTDMVTWTQTPDAMPTRPEWADKHDLTWAPDVVELDGQWVLFFSALFDGTQLHCIGHAVADTAVGPYEPFKDPIVCELPEGGSIDPMVHVDSEGGPHLLWKVDANAIGRRSVLRSQPLSSDGTELIGAPSDLLTYESGWEYPLIEQPELIETDGVLHLFYAGGWWNQNTYQVGHAICETVSGPCVRTTTDEGWISSSAGVEGPGALSVVSTPDGMVGVYHAWIDGVAPEDDEFRSLIVEPFTLNESGPARLEQ